MRRRKPSSLLTVAGAALASSRHVGAHRRRGDVEGTPAVEGGINWLERAGKGAEAPPAVGALAVQKAGLWIAVTEPTGILGYGAAGGRGDVGRK